jgi:hypothetical protein
MNLCIKTRWIKFGSLGDARRIVDRWAHQAAKWHFNFEISYLRFIEVGWRPSCSCTFTNGASRVFLLGPDSSMLQDGHLATEAFLH